MPAPRSVPEEWIAGDIILETRGFTKEFLGFTAVSGVDLKIRRGAIA
jgi:ABC-type branched-subunit amino acid transport system ATPase component